MKKSIFGLGLISSLLVSSLPVYGFDIYDIEDYQKEGKHWSAVYVDELQEGYGLYGPKGTNILEYKYDGVISKESAVNQMAKIRFAVDNKGNQEAIDNFNFDRYFNNYIEINKITNKILEREVGDLTRYDMAHYIVTAFKDKLNFRMNVVPEGSIKDIEHLKGTELYEEIYELYRCGIIGGINSNNDFGGDSYVTNGQFAIVLNRIVNPNVRTSLTMYLQENIELNSESYPMYYRNKDTGVEINITKEKHYDAVCYVSHILLKDPTYLKTIYANLEWEMFGAPISKVNGFVKPIFMVNGDYRSSLYGEDLGIIRHGEIVNDKAIKNAIVLYKNGKLEYVKKSTPKTMLERDVRETFTFGPLLVENGKVLKLDNQTRHPRTFIGQVDREDGLLEYYIIAADGRQEGYSMGLSNHEMATILKDKGCDLGYNLDGGGSTCMMFDGKLLNKPSDGCERADCDYIYIK